jgi:hypothetical protein
MQSLFRREPCCVGEQRCAKTRKPSGREARAALRAAARENLSPRTRGHASAEAVRALAVQIAGLKGSLHARYPARAKVLGKTRMWDGREAAHCTRGVVWLSTARAGPTGEFWCSTSARRRLWITATKAY